ncbi:MAG: hypothetical protein R2834_12390 [Rhodothermales bacterium]
MRSTTTYYPRTHNLKESVLRYLAAFVLFSLVVIPFWNRGPVFLARPESYGRAMVIKGADANHRLDRRGIARLHQYVTQELRPAFNPITILYQHLRYRYHPEAYELVVGAGEIPEADDLLPATREFAIYQSGDVVFLRIEPIGFNRVLVSKKSVREVEDMLAPYILD